MASNVADLNQGVTGQLALDRDVPLLIPARPVRGIDLVGGVGNGLVGARHAGVAGNQWRRGGCRKRRNRHRGAIDADAEAVRRIGAQTA